jgi:hypothetical protein
MQLLGNLILRTTLVIHSNEKILVTTVGLRTRNMNLTFASYESGAPPTRPWRLCLFVMVYVINPIHTGRRTSWPSCKVANVSDRCKPKYIRSSVRLSSQDLHAPIWQLTELTPPVRAGSCMFSAHRILLQFFFLPPASHFRFHCLTLCFTV